MPDTISYFVTGNADALEKRILAAYKRGESLFSKGFQLNVKGGRPLGKINGQLSEFQKSLEASNARVLAFGASTSVLYSLGRGFKALLSDMTDVEKKLNEIQSIFNTTTSGMKTLSSGLFQIAQETSQSFGQVSKAAVEFARQGLGVEKTLEATRAALILSRVANYDAASAVDALTAAVNTYADSGLSHIEIVNKMVAVDTAFAISASGIAEGLKRAGAVAADAGVDFDHLSAAITSVQQITARGASVIGNGLKTIFTRLQREDTRKVLEDIGVATANADGSFRDSISVLNDLSDKYVKLSDSQKAYVSQNVAGVYQINTFKALLSSLRGDFGLYDQVLKKSTDASNEALSKNDFLNQTFSSLLDRTRASITEFNSYVGEKAFSPPLKDITSKFKNLVDSLNQTAQGKGAFGETGKFIGDSILNGIKNSIAGPGLILITSLLLRTFNQTAKQSLDAFKTVSGISSAKQQQLDIETKIQAVLAGSDKFLVNQLVTTESLIKKRQILNQLIDAQLIKEQRTSAALSSLGGLVGAKQVKGLIGTKKNAASGYLPSLMREQSDILSGVGGARPSAKPLLKRIKNKNGVEPVVVNSDEYIVRNFLGGKEDAVFNRDMVLGLGGVDRLKTLGDVEHAASGRIPDSGALEREVLALSILRNNPSISATKLASQAKIGKAKALELKNQAKNGSLVNPPPAAIQQNTPQLKAPSLKLIKAQIKGQQAISLFGSILGYQSQLPPNKAPSLAPLPVAPNQNPTNLAPLPFLQQPKPKAPSVASINKQVQASLILAATQAHQANLPKSLNKGLAPLPVAPITGSSNLAPLPLLPPKLPPIIPQRLPNPSQGFIGAGGKKIFSLGPLGEDGLANTNGLSEDEAYMRKYLYNKAPSLNSGVSKILHRTSSDPASAQSKKLIEGLANKYLPSIQTLYDKTISLGLETEELSRAFGDASDQSKSEAERLRARAKLAKQVDVAETKIINRKAIEERRQQKVLSSGSILDALPGAGRFVAKRVKAAGFTGEAARQAKEDIIQNQKNKYNRSAGNLALAGAFGIPLIGGAIETAIQKSSFRDEKKLKYGKATSEISQAIGSGLALASLGPVGLAIGTLTTTIQVANAVYKASRESIEFLSKSASDAASSLEQQSTVVDKLPNLEEQLKEALSLGKGSLAIKLQDEIEKAFSSIPDSELASLVQRRSFASSDGSKDELSRKIEERKAFLQKDVNAKAFAAELESAIQETSSLFDNKVNLSEETIQNLSRALVENSNASEFLKYLDQLKSSDAGKAALDSVGLIRLLSENQKLNIRQKDLDKLASSKGEDNKPIEKALSKEVEQELIRKARREQTSSISFNLASINLKLDKTISRFVNSINREFEKAAKKQFDDLDFSLIGLNDKIANTELSPTSKAELNFQNSRIDIDKSTAEKFLGVKTEITKLLEASQKDNQQKSPAVLKALEDFRKSNGEDPKVFFRILDIINSTSGANSEEIGNQIDNIINNLENIEQDGKSALRKAEEIKQIEIERGRREERNAALLNSGKTFDNFDPKVLLDETIKGVNANLQNREEQVKKRRELVAKYGERSNQVSSFDQQQKLFELERVRARREFRGKEQAFAEPSDADIEAFKSIPKQIAQKEADKYNEVSKKYNELYKKKRAAEDLVNNEEYMLAYDPSEDRKIRVSKAKEESERINKEYQKFGSVVLDALPVNKDDFNLEYKTGPATPYIAPKDIKSYAPITTDESKLKDYYEYKSLDEKEKVVRERIDKELSKVRDGRSNKESARLAAELSSIINKRDEIIARNPSAKDGIPRDAPINLNDKEAIREYLRNRNLDKIKKADAKDSAFELNLAKNITASGVYSARSSDIQQKAGKNSNLDLRFQRENPIVSQLIDSGNIPGAIQRLRGVQNSYGNSKQAPEIQQLINDLTRISNQKELTPEQSKLLSKDRFGDISNLDEQKSLVEEAQRTHLPSISKIYELLEKSNLGKPKENEFDIKAILDRVDLSTKLNSSGSTFAQKEAEYVTQFEKLGMLEAKVKEAARKAAFEEFKDYPNRRPDTPENRDLFKKSSIKYTEQEMADIGLGNVTQEDLAEKKYKQFLLGPLAPNGRKQSSVDIEKQFNDKYKGDIPETVKNDKAYTDLKNLLEEIRKTAKEREDAAKTYNEASEKLGQDNKIEVKETGTLPGEDIITSSIKNGIESATLALQNKINVEVNINSGDLKEVISEAIIGFYRSQNGGKAPAVLPSNFEKASRTV